MERRLNIQNHNQPPNRLPEPTVRNAGGFRREAAVALLFSSASRRIKNMKTSLLLLLLGLMLGGCSKPSASRTFSPVHTNLEVRIMSKISGEGAIQPYFGDHAVPRWEGTVTLGDAAYSVVIEYKGTQNERDYYWVALTLPQGAVGVPAPAEIAYDGQPIELWSDSKASIGIHPLK